MKFDLLVALFIVWSVIILPYRIAFDDIPTWEANPEAYVFEWCVDFIFLIDIFSSFRTTYVARGDQICIVSTKKIARNYLESWFVVDVMSTLPLDLIIEGIVTATSPAGADGEQNLEILKLIRIVRLVRLIKLARLFKLGKLADSISEFIDSPYLLQLVTLLLMTVFVSHLLGCFWFLISPYHITDPTQTWWGGSMLAATKADHYLASVYWSFSTMTTVGYGDFVPQSTGERLYAVVAMIIGATIFGYVIGNVASMSMTADIAGMRKQERITNVLGYMKEKNVSTELKRKVESYLEFYFEHCSGFEDTSLIDELPEQLQTRVHEFLHGPTVDKFTKTLFKDIRRDAATRIISKLRTEVFVAGDILFTQGDIGQAMYLVEKGVVLCVTDIDTPKEKIIRKQIEGSHFGQYSMLGKGDIPHPFTAAVAESTVVLVMSRANVGIMVEEEAMLGAELQKLFTEHVRFSVTAEQRKGLAKSEDTSFSVAPSVNRMMLRKVQSYKKKADVNIGEGENGGEAGVEEEASGRPEMKEEQ
jgi:CRP-like cAMP-binding protein